MRVEQISRKELQKRMDKRWADFKIEIMEMYDKFEQVHLQLQRTLVKLKNDANPYGLPYGYGDKR